ncbi:hypothetical protein [Candidatus Odyssella acanthamoebae]|uniref:Uncharacterized protein n=1 Tax=Candidatus Odyssella acanthamoebae TaxID=91604 RepID=A0A077AZC7_9PROT|nr:hypothetical protein [Candidatus Paracaedibacter acanthamoebae]AIK96110.1 hypothetical protein ID47_04180 [Candidatus Paracaedibacter acanthamoebae]
MKVTTIKFSISLGLLTILNLPTLASENQDWQIELQQRVHGFGVDTLFREHQLPKTIRESSYAKEAYNKGRRMLMDKEGIKALPYLAYAEHYMVAESLTALERVGAGFYEKIPENIQTQIKQALSSYNSEFSRYNNQGSIFKMYLNYWNKNEELLINSQKSSFFGSLGKLIFGDAQGEKSNSSKAFFGDLHKNPPLRFSREGTAEDLIPLLPGERDGKIKKE